MENGETLIEGACREVREEVQAEVVIDHLHTIYNITHVDQVYFLFLAHLKNKDFKAGDETSDVRLFAPEEIPWNDLAFYSNYFALRKYLDEPDYTGVHYGDNERYKELLAKHS